jgi:hypothetical protein
MIYQSSLREKPFSEYRGSYVGRATGEAILTSQSTELGVSQMYSSRVFAVGESQIRAPSFHAVASSRVHGRGKRREF